VFLFIFRKHQGIYVNSNSRQYSLAKEIEKRVKSELISIKYNYNEHKHQTKFLNNSKKTKIQTLERKIKIVVIS